MLSKPGEARNSTPTYRNRKVVSEETPDDIVRRLQRVPSNKACADCSSKLTQCVNLTHGTFVCMACSGVHREFNHKIKGIGHSSFTPDEILKLNHPSSGNEAVNARYLAKYNANNASVRGGSSYDDHHSGRMSGSMSIQMPTNNNNLQHLRSWIQLKYIDKYWFEGEGGNDCRPSSAAKSKSKDALTTGRRKIMPKIHEPRTSNPPAPKNDPFSMSSSAFNNNDEAWDPFSGGSSSVANSIADAAAPSLAVNAAVPQAAPELWDAFSGGSSSAANFIADVAAPSLAVLAAAPPTSHNNNDEAWDAFSGSSSSAVNFIADVAAPSLSVVNAAPPTSSAAFQANDKMRAFDAFDDLSLKPTPTETASITRVNDEEFSGAAASPSRTEMNQSTPPPIRHQEGQKDDSNDSNNDDAFITKTELLKETILMIQKLNPQQLMQVRQLIASMLPSSSSGNNCNPDATSAASSFTGMKSQMNIYASQARQQQITVLGDVNKAGGMFPMQSFPQPSSGPQFSMQQGQSPHIPYPVQSTSTPVQYFSTEHHFENGVPQQAMGISNNHTAVPMGAMHRPPDATLSLSPPPPPVAAFVSPALPPIEKEGNPFDF